MGVKVYEYCKARQIPVAIVTDAFHHGIEFQPFVGNVGRYFDQLTDGRKQWEAALKELQGAK
jgi:hypothetical protein